MSHHKWSAVIPCRDTSWDRQCIAQSLPSVRKLGCDEIILGVDHPADQSFVDGLTELDPGIRIVQVGRHRAWKLHPAHVVYECFMASSHDRILQLNADTVALPGAMEGLHIVGPSSPLVSTLEKLTVDRPVKLLRYVVSRIHHIRENPPPPSGTYWIYRPGIITPEVVDRMRSIHNGFDTVLAEAAGDAITTLRTYGGRVLGDTQYDVPWRQAQKGIWLRGHYGRHPRHFARAMLASAAMARPWTAWGWIWADRHQSHPAVQRAGGLNHNQYSMLGSSLISNIRDWGGKNAVGFHESG